MPIRYAKPEVCEGNRCLRPYNSKSSYIMDASNNLAQNSTLNSTLNNSNTSTNSTGLANNTLEKSYLLIFVANYSTNSPNFRAPSQQRCGLSRVNSIGSDTNPKSGQDETFSRPFCGRSGTVHTEGPCPISGQVPEAETDEAGPTKRSG